MDCARSGCRWLLSLLILGGSKVEVVRGRVVLVAVDVVRVRRRRRRRWVHGRHRRVQLGIPGQHLRF